MNETLIIGGGLIGMLTALELANSGERVRILEQGEAGRESSWAGGGILSPLYPWRYPEPVTLLASWGQARYQGLARELSEETGINPEWTCSGMLMLDIDEDERDEAIGWAFRYGYEMEFIEAAGLQRIEQALGGGHSGGLWMPAVAQMRNPRLLRALRYKLESMDVGFSENCPVERLAIDNGLIRGVVAAGETLPAQRVIAASGAWSGELLKSAGLELPVEPVRGQMLLYKANPNLLNRIVLGDGHYAIPRRDGHILVGSTMERVGFNKQTTVQGHNELVTAAHALIPALKDTPIVKQWAGLRPGSPDGIPYIGAHPSVGGLFINTGQFRNGVVMGLASARLLADIVLQRTPIIDPALFAIDR